MEAHTPSAPLWPGAPTAQQTIGMSSPCDTPVVTMVTSGPMQDDAPHGDAQQTMLRACVLTGMTHGVLEHVALLLIGHKEAVELGLRAENDHRETWLCAWDYAELRFAKPAITGRDNGKP